MSKVNTTQTPKDMVFSQTSLETRSILKVVELNHLKPEKVNDGTGESTGEITETSEPQPMVSPSFTEVFLKPEPLFEDTMFNESGSEYFQGLEQWCLDPAKEEPVQIDSLKNREDNSHYTDTQNTTHSPTGWDVIDSNSPAQAGFYTSTSNYPLSPNMDGFAIPDNKFLYSSDIGTEKKIQHNESFWDIPNLPVLIGELAPEELVDLTSCSATNKVGLYNTHNLLNTEYNTTVHSHKMLLTDEEDSLDIKMNPVIPTEVEKNNVTISEYILSEPGNGGILERGSRQVATAVGLSLNVEAPWAADSISTPEVLNYVDQLEREKYIMPTAKTARHSPLQDTGLVTMNSCPHTTTPPVDYHPITPKSDTFVESDAEDVKPQSSKRKQHDSEDSDETYTPHIEYTPRKYKRRKPSVPIKDMILALEESRQLPKARRGRPPKRRESTVSSIGSIDDNTSSISTHEVKYRELRDKNNEASKRSRMNRKLKELQMEQHALELEERNKKLQVKADILEDMTKRLKEALMTAILQK